MSYAYVGNNFKMIRNHARRGSAARLVAVIIFPVLGFASVLTLPWPFAVAVAVISGFISPLAPFAIGLFADAMYYVPGVEAWPVASIVGAATSVLISFVRLKLRPGIIN